MSLTSYPLRFPTLPLTLKCLLMQSMKPDHLFLWIAQDDERYLTKEILDLRSTGVTIKFCDDLRSYKKLVPSLKECPDAFIATADDDVYYWPTWLEELVTQQGGAREVVCHWAHRVRVSADGRPLQYQRWEQGIRSRDASPLVFPVGVGGVLYPPGAFHDDVLDESVFQDICADADDIWWYWMARRVGTVARKVGSRRLFPTWVGTQYSALHHRNTLGGANDRCVAAMTERFGFPVSLSV